MSIFEIFQYDFARNALFAAVLVSIAAGIIGPLILAARMVSLIGGVAHAAYGGLGVALYFALPAMPSSLAFASICALLIAYISRKNPAHAQSSVAVIWAFGMAVGVFFADLAPGSSAAVMNYLFGAILATSEADLAYALGACVLALAFVAVFYSQLQSLCIDSEFARASGILEAFLSYALVFIAAVLIIVCLRAVGVVLIVAIFSIPAYIASMFSLRLASTMLLASGLSLIFCLVGLFMAIVFDFSATACITAAACASFLIALALKSLRRN